MCYKEFKVLCFWISSLQLVVEVTDCSFGRDPDSGQTEASSVNEPLLVQYWLLTPPLQLWNHWAKLAVWAPSAWESPQGGKKVVFRWNWSLKSSHLDVLVGRLVENLASGCGTVAKGHHPTIQVDFYYTYKCVTITALGLASIGMQEANSKS